MKRGMKRYPNLARLAGGDPLKRWPNVSGLDIGIAEGKSGDGVPDRRIVTFLDRAEKSRRGLLGLPAAKEPAAVMMDLPAAVRRGLLALLEPLVVDGLHGTVGEDELRDHNVSDDMLSDARAAERWIHSLKEGADG